MARSKWIGTLIVALASSWLAFGQQAAAPPTPAPGPGERILTVQEEGKPAQKCKVIKSWTTPEGSQALQVQDLDTGEIMTILEDGQIVSSGLGNRMRTMTTRIFHWGSDKTPPPGVPLPPQTVVVQGPAVPMRSSTPMNVVQSAPATGLLAPRTTRAPKMTTPVVVAQPSTQPMANSTTTTTIVSQSTPSQPVIVQGPVVMPGSSTMIKSNRNDSGLLSRLFSKNEKKTVVKAPTGASKQTSVASTASTPAKVEPAQPNDWRQSWGKVEGEKTTVTAASQTGDPSSPQAIKNEPSPSLAQGPSLFDVPKAQPTRVPDAPRASAGPGDPLKDPVSYGSSKVEPAKTPAKTTSLASSKPAKPTAKAPAKKSEPPAPATAPAAVAAKESPVPLGAASVLAAGNVQYVPVPIVTMPNVNRPPQPTPPQIPQAPQPNQRLVANAAPIPQRGAQPMVVANAFMPASSMPINPAMAGTVPYYPGTPAMAGPMPPMGPAGQGMAPQAMMARGIYPVPAAQLMMPPALPAGRGVAPAGFQGQPLTGMQPAMLSAPDMPQCMVILRESMYPSQREWSADKLSSCRWQTNPQVVDSLVAALRDDPAPSVRAACARSLAKMEANTVPVITTLRALKDDPDANVRFEVEQALLTLDSNRAGSAVQSSGGLVPIK